MQWNEPVNAAQQRVVADILGGGMASEALRRFIRGLGLPTTLGEVGIAEAEIPALAAKWDGGPPIATNPRTVDGTADVEAILRLML
jgi:maleylacetate reductase